MFLYFISAPQNNDVTYIYLNRYYYILLMNVFVYDAGCLYMKHSSDESDILGYRMKGETFASITKDHIEIFISSLVSTRQYETCQHSSQDVRNLPQGYKFWEKVGGYKDTRNPYKKMWSDGQPEEKRE